MLKALPKYLLFGFIFLLGGSRSLFAHTQKISSPGASVETFESTITATSISFQNSDTFPVSYAALDPEKQDCEISEPVLMSEENDNDDDDKLIVSKRHFDNSYYSTSVFLSQTPVLSFNDDKKMEPFYKQLNYTSSCRYILFEVFRI